MTLIILKEYEKLNPSILPREYISNHLIRFQDMSIFNKNMSFFSLILNQYSFCFLLCLFDFLFFLKLWNTEEAIPIPISELKIAPPSYIGSRVSNQDIIKKINNQNQKSLFLIVLYFILLILVLLYFLNIFAGFLDIIHISLFYFLYFCCLFTLVKFILFYIIEKESFLKNLIIYIVLMALLGGLIVLLFYINENEDCMSFVRYFYSLYLYWNWFINLPKDKRATLISEYEYNKNKILDGSINMEDLKNINEIEGKMSNLMHNFTFLNYKDFLNLSYKNKSYEDLKSSILKIDDILNQNENKLLLSYNLGCLSLYYHGDLIIIKRHYFKKHEDELILMLNKENKYIDLFKKIPGINSRDFHSWSPNLKEIINQIINKRYNFQIISKDDILVRNNFLNKNVNIICETAIELKSKKNGLMFLKYDLGIILLEIQDNNLNVYEYNEDSRKLCMTIARSTEQSNIDIKIINKKSGITYDNIEYIPYQLRAIFKTIYDF
jgi:hypothetical protein